MPTSVHLDFLMLTPFLLSLLASENASPFTSLLSIVLDNGPRSGWLQRFRVCGVLCSSCLATLLFETKDCFGSSVQGVGGVSRIPPMLLRLDG